MGLKGEPVRYVQKSYLLQEDGTKEKNPLDSFEVSFSEKGFITEEVTNRKSKKTTDRYIYSQHRDTVICEKTIDDGGSKQVFIMKITYLNDSTDQLTFFQEGVEAAFPEEMYYKYRDINTVAYQHFKKGDIYECLESILDDKRNTMESITWIWGNIYEHERYEYNNEGLIVRTHNLPSERVKIKKTISYEYRQIDEHGNWTECIATDDENGIRLFVTRKITYK